MTNHVIQPQVDCFTAQEFLDALSPLGQYFKDENLSESWLFRGQGADWPLVPSLFRTTPEAIAKLRSLTKKDITDYDVLLDVERDLLLRFFEIADKRGLSLPDDSQILRLYLKKLKFKTLDEDALVGSDERVWDKSLSLMALAQHFGLPTLLVDWTRQAYIAAFFAAESVASEKKESTVSEYLVVWAFNFPYEGNRFPYWRSPIRLVTAPSATNPNLREQLGVFTLMEGSYPRDEDGKYVPLDKYLEEYSEDQYIERDKVVRLFKLRKFTLPVSEASKLLYLLAKLDFTPSAIYPGYHSIVSDIEKQNTWE